VDVAPDRRSVDLALDSTHTLPELAEHVIKRAALPRWGHLKNALFKLLLDSLQSPEYLLEQLPLGRNSRLGGHGFKIASKVLRRDPR
jgi:hypothetical protein